MRPDGGRAARDKGRPRRRRLSGYGGWPPVRPALLKSRQTAPSGEQYGDDGQGDGAANR